MTIAIQRIYFIKMGISANELRPSPTPLKGFSRDMIQLVSAITLPLTAGLGARTAATMINFLAVKAPSSYKATLGQLILNNLKAITSTYHLKMKLPTNGRIGEARDKHTLAWECYV